jgi:uncharacterized protein (TIGR03000 family)
MFQRIVARSNLAALAVLGSLLVAGPAAAQQGQHLFEWSGGWSRSSEGSSYAGGYGGLEYPAPSYYTAPGGPVTGYQPVYTPPIGQEYGYFAPSGAGEAPAVNRAVLINVSVPANAQIWVEGKRTTDSGAFRQFISPPLPPGREFSYDIKVRWTEDGKEVTRSRHITVHAGDVVNLSFNSGTASVSSGR